MITNRSFYSTVCLAVPCTDIVRFIITPTVVPAIVCANLEQYCRTGNVISDNRISVFIACCSSSQHFFCNTVDLDSTCPYSVFVSHRNIFIAVIAPVAERTCNTVILFIKIFNIIIFGIIIFCLIFLYNFICNRPNLPYFRVIKRIFLKIS